MPLLKKGAREGTGQQEMLGEKKSRFAGFIKSRQNKARAAEKGDHYTVLGEQLHLGNLRIFSHGLLQNSSI